MAAPSVMTWLGWLAIRDHQCALLYLHLFDLSQLIIIMFIPDLSQFVTVCYIPV
jgi:hypothetical protein